MTTYRVRNWKEHFEVGDQKRYQYKGGFSFVGVPTKHDGKTFRRLAKLDDAAAIYGAWILILAVAGKCPERGTLADEDGPLTPEDLEAKTGFAADCFARAFEVLTSERFQWIEQTPTGCNVGQRFIPPTIPDHTIPDITIHNPTPQGTGGVSKTRFRLGKKESWNEIHTPAGAKRVYEAALAAAVCTPDERHHVTRLILSLNGKAENPVGALVSILNGGGKDSWRSRGGDFDQQAKDWMREVDVPPEMRKRTSDLATGPPSGNLKAEMIARLAEIDKSKRTP